MSALSTRLQNSTIAMLYTKMRVSGVTLYMSDKAVGIPAQGYT